MSNSIWAYNIDLPVFPSLEHHIDTEVLVIGGGMCGILCAYYLGRSGIPYVLVEGKRIGHGITKNTTAKITSQHGLIYHKIAKKKGMKQAGLYLKANETALNEYKKLAGTIDCDFEEQNAYTYSTVSSDNIHDELAVLQALGFPAKFFAHPNIPIETQGAIMFPNQSQFHPLKFLAGISTNLNIFENTFIHHIDKHTAYSEKGSVTARHIIVATHFPFLNKHGSYFLKQYQSRSYVIALENASNVNGMYVDEAKEGLSFRNYGNYLLIGGSEHRTGHKGSNWKELRSFIQKTYPHADERYIWAAQDCISLDNIPYIGQYSANTPNMYVASGFRKWGMTSSMVAALMLTDMVCGKENVWQMVYNPSRNIIKPQLFINAGEAVIHLFTPTTKRCSHMGCSLKWNEAEQSWDCPCHGSRYQKDGTLIDNPAKKDIVP